MEYIYITGNRHFKKRNLSCASASKHKQPRILSARIRQDAQTGIQTDKAGVNRSVDATEQMGLIITPGV